MELPKRILAMIPEEWLKEAADNPIEFQATVNIGRCQDRTMAVLVTVMDKEGKPMNGWQFMADLETNYEQGGERVILADKGSGATVTGKLSEPCF